VTDAGRRTLATLPGVRRHHLIMLSVVLLAAALAGCGGSKSNTAGTTPPGNSGHVAKPVSSKPSTSAKMICSSEVQGDIARLVGVQIVKPLAPTWIDHVYSCTYEYKNGTMTLSVKELANQAETDAYFASLATKLGKTEQITGLGQGAFTTKNLSAVVRKDYKVLTVDISHMPANFGVPPQSRADIALNTAATIMGCWTGA
jgi:hypothetical protein